VCRAKISEPTNATDGSYSPATASKASLFDHVGCWEPTAISMSRKETPGSTVLVSSPLSVSHDMVGWGKRVISRHFAGGLPGEVQDPHLVAVVFPLWVLMCSALTHTLAPHTSTFSHRVGNVKRVVHARSNLLHWRGRSLLSRNHEHVLPAGKFS
jgi:hypothetical protein